MEPTDQYLKSRRNLVLFSGLLAPSATVGLDFTSKESGSLLPVTLRDANFLDEIFAVLVLYFAFQASLFWSAQSSSVQRLPQYKIDFWSSIVLSAAALLAYVFPIIQSLTEAAYLYASRYWGGLYQIRYLDLIPETVATFLSALTAYLMFAAITRFARKTISASRVRRRDTEALILSKLIGSQWRLIFNPTSLKSKKISFHEDGNVGDGQNNNEHTWRVRAGMLVILNSDRQIFSRFRYDEDKDCFFHTNDDDTLSIRSQRIEPWAEQSD
jgi:hypothetical protein